MSEFHSHESAESSEDSPLFAARPDGALAYDSPRAYHATGKVHVPGLLLALAGGLIAAILAALAAWVWMYFNLPSYLVLPMIMQGLVVGAVLAYLFRRARLRNPQ